MSRSTEAGRPWSNRLCRRRNLRHHIVPLTTAPDSDPRQKGRLLGPQEALPDPDDGMPAAVVITQHVISQMQRNGGDAGDARRPAVACLSHMQLRAQACVWTLCLFPMRPCWQLLRQSCCRTSSLDMPSPSSLERRCRRIARANNHGQAVSSLPGCWPVSGHPRWPADPQLIRPARLFLGSRRTISGSKSLQSLVLGWYRQDRLPRGQL